VAILSEADIAAIGRGERPAAKKGRVRRAKSATRRACQYGIDPDDETKCLPKWRAVQLGLVKGKAFGEKVERKIESKTINALASTILGRPAGPFSPLRRVTSAGSAGVSKTGAALLRVGRASVGASLGGTVALAMLAGVASYYATTYIINRLAAAKEARTPDHIAYEAAMAYRQARLDAAAKAGRELTSKEAAFLASEFKKKLATIGGRSFTPTTRPEK
jgi:hypothetical protein